MGTPGIYISYLINQPLITIITMTLIVKIMGLIIFIWLSPMWKWGDTSFKEIKVYFPRLKKKKNLSTRFGATRTQRNSQTFQNARERIFLLSYGFIHINDKFWLYSPSVPLWHPLSFPIIFPPSPPAKLLEKMLCPLQQLWTVTVSTGGGLWLSSVHVRRTLSCMGICSCVCSWL